MESMDEVDTMTDYSSDEMMIAAAARALAGKRVVFVGVGLPNIACNLAQRTVAPDIELVYESGVFGARPARQPLSIGDPTLVSGATSVCPISELFMNYLQGGRIEVAFLGAAQIDRFGNLNTTVVGDYHQPQVRLPGSGGACEIALMAQEILIIMPLGRRAFVDKIDFVTSPGHLTGGDARREHGMPGAGPQVVVTDMAILDFDNPEREMQLVSLHPGVTLGDVRAEVGWDLRVADEVKETPAPSGEELRLIRVELDPEGMYR
jgi:glutaconate CoA-transferase subunit B